MASMEFRFYSKCLRQSTSVFVILPEISKTQEGVGLPQKPFKTLWLLHGLNGNEYAWQKGTSIERYADKYSLAVIMPCVDRSWYTDTATGTRYFSFITEELPAICRSYFKGLSDKREDNLVIGLSMGGYGALKCALTLPEAYGYVASLSGALDITRKGRPYDLAEWRGIFGFDLASAEELSGTKHDLFHLLKENCEAGRPLPKTYLWCGTEDPLIATNRDFRDLLRDKGVPHRYEESEGNHTWRWWDEHICDALDYLLKE